ncbi:uncharacterized protein [Prorops nasuta]|uniref:uncharacterized protein n=1 Tax=Prorops nasuta TaxID=863751 RepID=UPI0034CEAD6F
MADMHLVYGKADGNSSKAARLYREKFPNRRHPDRRFFISLAQRLRENGSFEYQKAPGASRTTRTVEFEEAVLNRVREDPTLSTRAIAYELQTSNTNVWRVLNEEGMHPYHYRKVQGLKPTDFHARVHFCEWFLRKCGEDNGFARSVLFTDEACFTRNGFFNSRNSHQWDFENPRACFVASNQNRFSVNVWAGIINNQLIGPYFLPRRLTGTIYTEFIKDILPVLLEDVPLSVRQEMWFQSDGAPPHFNRQANNLVVEKFQRRWIGRGAPVQWPPRSPDLTPLDFFLWGHVKSLVYVTPVETENQLIERIVTSFDEVMNTPGIFDRVRTSMLRRCEACIRVRGNHFEQLI